MIRPPVSPGKRVTNWICSVMFLMVSLIFPFLIAVTYHEHIPQKTMHIAIGMYLLTIATTARNQAVFFFLLVFSLYMVASYGAYKETDYFTFPTDMYNIKGLVVLVSTIVAVTEKWHHHFVRGESFLPFNDKTLNDPYNR